MRSPLGFLLALLAALVTAPTCLGMTSPRAVTLKDFPSDFSAFLTNPPAAVTSFLTTDAHVAIAVAVTGAQIGDVISVDYVMPSGQVSSALSHSWNALTADNMGQPFNMVLDLLPIAGQLPASTPGQWSARFYYHPASTTARTLLTTLTVTIAAAGGGSCTYTLGATSASVVAGDYTGTVTVTAASGCSWTAVSNNTSWLTVYGGSFGSGNGMVTYMVTVNSSTSPRSGTLTIAGQPFTVTQAGAFSGTNLTVKELYLLGGSYSAGNFSSNPVSYSTGGGFMVYPLGVSAPSTSSPLLNGSDSINIPPGTYYLYLANRPSTLGSAVMLTAIWSDGSQSDSIFSVGSLTSAGNWPLIQDSGFLSLGGTGINANRVNTTGLNPDSSSNIVLALTITAPGSGGGGGGGGSCSYTLGAASASLAASATTGTVSVTAASGCAWTAVSNNTSWLTVTSGASGSGNGTVSFSATANTGSSSRTGTITIGGQTFTIAQAAASACWYQLTPTSQSMGGAFWSGSVAVSAPVGCPWTAVSSVSWITVISGGSGSGNGMFYYNVATNPDTTARTGAITVMGQAFSIQQFGSNPTCNYMIGVPWASAPAGGTPGTVSVSAESGCTWTAVSNNTSWLTVTSGAIGSGNGTVAYSVAANASSSSRTGTITIAGYTFTVAQVGSTGTDVVLAVDGGTFARTLGFNQGLPHIYFVNRLTPPSYPATLKNVQIYFGNRSNGLPLNNPITVVWAAASGGGNTLSGGSFNTLPATVTALGSFSTYTVSSTTIASSDFLVGFEVDNPPGIYPADVDTSSPSQQRSYYSSDGVTFGLLDAAGLAGNLAIRATVTLGSGSGGGGACTASISPTSQTIAASGGSGSVSVTDGNGCTWTANSSDSWASIASGASGSGNGTVQYSVAANTGTSARTATLTIAGLAFTLTQSGTSGGGGGGTSGNLLVNGSFEQPGGNDILGATGSAITGWHVVAGINVDYIHSYFTCSDGAFCLDLDGTPGAGGIAQTFATTAGATYTVTFDMAGNPGGGPSVKQMRVQAAGQSANFSFDITGHSANSMGWATKTWTFTANSSSTTLEFDSLDGSSSLFGPALDNVRVTAGTGSGGGGGGSGANATGITLEGGAYASGTFSGNQQVWDTLSTSWHWVLGVSAPSVTSPLLNASDKSVNIPAGTYYLYAEPTSASFGTAVRLTVQWSGGGQDQAIFAPASLSTAGNWTRLSGSTNLSLASSGIANANRVSTNLSAGGDMDNVLQLTIGASGAGGGGGGGGGCTYQLESPATTAMPASTTGTLAISTQNGCPWTAVSNASWITITSATSGTGTTIIFYKLDTNSGQNQRLGTITVGGQTYYITQSGMSACSYVISLNSATAPAAGTSNYVNLTTSVGCPYTVTSNASWITITSSAADIDSGVVKYTVAPYTGTSPRTGTITIAGLTFTITQSGICTYSISPTIAAVAAAGGTGGVSVTVAGGCPWTAAANANWITIASGSSGSGNGTVNYSVGANTATTARTGTATIATQTFTVTQAAAVTGQGPTLNDGGVVNAADYTANFAPGMIISLYGSNFAVAATGASTIPLPNNMGGVSVEVVDGSQVLNAPLFFVSQFQINAQLPFNMTSSSVQVRVRNAQGVSGAQTIAITPRSPRLFTQTQDGKGDAVVVHADYSVVNANSPAAPGETLILFLTGLGAVSPAIAAGQAGGDGSASKPVNLVSGTVFVSVDGFPATVPFAGLAPYYVGLYQVNFQVPVNAAIGNLPITIMASSQISQSQVSFACGMTWHASGNATIGASGGTVNAGNLTLAVPSGSFAASTPITVQVANNPPVDPDRAGDVFAVTGMPSTTAAPIAISINVPGAPLVADQTYISLQEPGSGVGPLYLKATVQGNVVSANLPPRMAVANSSMAVGGSKPQANSSMAAAGNQPQADALETLIVEVLTGVGSADSPSGNFQLLYDKSLTKADMDNLAKAADDVPFTLNEIGFGDAWNSVAKTGGLVVVVKGDSDTSDITSRVSEWWGDVRFSRGDAWGNDTIDLSLPPAVAGNKLLATAKLGHLVMHMLQGRLRSAKVELDQRNSGNRPWLWMDEATASYFEWIYTNGTPVQSASAPLQITTDVAQRFVLDPLETPLTKPATNNMDIERVRWHGWGATYLIRYLSETLSHTPGYFGATAAGQIYAYKTVSPVEAIRTIATLAALLNIGHDVWLPFCRDYFLNWMNQSSFLTFNDINMATPALLPQVWNAFDLSANFYDLFLIGTWTGGTTLTVTAGAGTTVTPSPEVMAYKHCVSNTGIGMTPIQGADGSPTISITSPLSYLVPGCDIPVIVVNEAAANNFQNQHLIPLTVGTGQPAITAPWTTGPEKIAVNLNVPINSHTLNQPPSFTLEYPPVICSATGGITWSGLSFTVTNATGTVGNSSQAACTINGNGTATWDPATNKATISTATFTITDTNPTDSQFYPSGKFVLTFKVASVGSSGGACQITPQTGSPTSYGLNCMVFNDAMFANHTTLVPDSSVSYQSFNLKGTQIADGTLEWSAIGPNASTDYPTQTALWIEMWHGDLLKSPTANRVVRPAVGK